MEINEALDVARTVKSRYQAFEKIDEVLTSFAQYQAAAGDAKRAVEAARKEELDTKKRISDMQDSVTSLSDEVDEWEAKRDSAKTDAEKAMVQAREGMKDQLKLMEDTLQKATTEHTDALANLKELYLSRKDALEAEINDLVARRDSILEALQGVKV